MRFDPMSYMRNAEKANANFSNTERSLKDFTEQVMADIATTAKAPMFSQSVLKKAKRNASVRNSTEFRRERDSIEHRGFSNMRKSGGYMVSSMTSALSAAAID